MKTVSNRKQRSNGHNEKISTALREEVTRSRNKYEEQPLDIKASLLQELNTLGLMLVHEELEREISRLVGYRYERTTSPNVRHGSNPGSIYLGGQKIKTRIPRVRNRQSHEEVPLASLEAIRQEGRKHDETLFKRVLLGVSCHRYEEAADALPGALGLSASSVSRTFKKVSAKRLAELNTRDLSCYDFIGLVLDGKSCAKELMFIALGITMDGKKIPLGLAQMGTENEKAISEFLKSLKERGLKSAQGLLAVIDGSKGICAAVEKTFAGEVVIQRCQWHKRENVVSYLKKEEQEYFRARLQRAYEKPTYKEAKHALNLLGKELSLKNISAENSLAEGLEATLTLHRLEVFSELGFSLKTTNILESINSQIEQKCGKVKHYKNSSQRLRWYASALLDIEPCLHRINGYKELPKLRAAIKKELKLNEVNDVPMKKAA